MNAFEAQGLFSLRASISTIDSSPFNLSPRRILVTSRLIRCGMTMTLTEVLVRLAASYVCRDLFIPVAL